METNSATVINVQELEPRLRHQTIFNVFDTLAQGESLIIHNNHDPKPVYYQLMDIRGNIFSWEYLSEGPEWWDIKVTRTVPILPGVGQELILNIPAIEPRYKHESIFHVFDHLQTGESFIIHNNHDPKPVYHQLVETRGAIFDWEYIQQGPQFWDIRVTKKEVAQAPIYKDELVVNVPSIEPRSKHATIFRVFDSMQPGETFIILNDHDPKPLYYQLLNERGEVFEWEYIQSGPQWWRIRVRILDTKNKVETTEADSSKAPHLAYAKPDEKVVNVPSLEPRVKHATIFETFDSLAAGESMIIHNDHDPKPVYYQLQNERGDVFEWEYLQSGPQWWDIRLTKKGSTYTETIGELVKNDINKVAVFKKYGIDFCCGGKKTVRQACLEKGIDPIVVENELRQTKATAQTTALNYDDWNLDFLADFIVNTHHSYVKKQIPEIYAFALKVAQVHGNRHQELAAIRDLVQNVKEELLEHMVEEEDLLFPTIKKIIKTDKNADPEHKELFEHFEQAVRNAEEEHLSVGKAMEQIRTLSQNYAIPEDACTTYKLLYKMLEEFESDLFTHIHLENNILFPKALQFLNQSNA